jgi:hypothetical protein
MPRKPGNFRLEDMPVFSGWRNAWFQVYRVMVIAGYSEPVVRGTLHWHNNSCHRAWITSDGNLVVSLRPEYPRRGLEAVADETDPVHAVVSASHRLTDEEIATASRGAVHGAVVGENNGCRVSHVTDETVDGAFLCMLYGPVGIPGMTEVLSQEVVASHVPQLAAEYQHRMCCRFPEEFADQLAKYLDAFFSRCQVNDAHARGLMQVQRHGPLVKDEDGRGSPTANVVALGKIAEEFKSSLAHVYQ